MSGLGLKYRVVNEKDVELGVRYHRQQLDCWRRSTQRTGLLWSEHTTFLLRTRQWVTGEENDNVGFMVFRRRADENDEFMEIASFKTYPPLNSKG